MTKTVLNYFCLFRNNDAGFVLSELSGIGKLVLLTKGEIKLIMIYKNNGKSYRFLERKTNSENYYLDPLKII